MAAQNVCRYFKFGFCKFTDRCRFQHVEEICGNLSCEIKRCNLRHPKVCKFFRDYNRCKFGEWCCFKHITNNTEIDAISTETIRKEIEALQKIINDKDEVINQLSEKIKVIEDKLFSVEIIEKEDESFKCKECEFVGKNVKGLNIHMKRIHGPCNSSEDKEETFIDDKINEMEKRIYKLEKRRLGSDFCEFCDLEFMSGSEKDRKEKELHIRQTHTFECAVCDLKHTNKEELETHIRTCEIYVCSLCSYRHKRLSDLKTHCKTKHTRNTIIKHQKMDRDSFAKLSSKNYFSEEV